MSRKINPTAAEADKTRAAIITQSTALIRGTQRAIINVHDARSKNARIIVNWNDMMMTFHSADATQGLLEAFASTRASLARVPYELPARRAADRQPAARSTLAIEWFRRPGYSAITQSTPGRGPRAATQYWVELYTESITWQIRDIIGLRSSIESLRNIHRTAAAVLLDGHEHRKDPSADKPLTNTA